MSDIGKNAWGIGARVSELEKGGTMVVTLKGTPTNLTADKTFDEIYAHLKGGNYDVVCYWDPTNAGYSNTLFNLSGFSTGVIEFFRVTIVSTSVTIEGIAIRPDAVERVFKSITA